MIRSLIKLGRLVDADVIRCAPSRSERSEWEFFDRGALSLLKTVETPVLVNHDEAQRVGLVREICEFRDVAGTWLCALTTITDPPGWLKIGSPASISYHLATESTLGGRSRVLRGVMAECSILSPSRRPAQPGARVLTMTGGR